MSLRILQVISTPPFAWAAGGCARVVFDISNGLVKRGHDVTILTTDLYEPKKRYPIKNPEIVDGVKIIRFKNISDRLAWKYKLYLAPGIFNYLKGHLREYDLVHLQDLISLQAFLTSQFCKKSGVPYVLTAHGSVFWLQQNKLLNQLYYKLVGTRVIKNSEKIIALTKTEIEQFKDIGIENDKIVLIPNGIEVLGIEKIKRGSFRKKYNIGNDQNIILFLGRIHKIKGIHLLIQSFNEVLQKLNNSILVIVGPNDGFLPELKNQIEKLGLEDKTLITGPLYEKSKYEAYLDADIYVLPSIYETFPMTIIEACASGTPVILTNNCGISDIIHGNAGFAVSYDKNSLKDAMMEILIDNDLKKMFGLNAKILANEIFNLESSLDALENTYKKCLNSFDKKNYH